MKMFYLIYFLLFSFFCNGQNKALGKYSNHFGSRLQIDSNFTFTYTWRFDLESSWTNGTWYIRNDTFYLNPVLVFDTLRLLDDKGEFIKDSIILSNNQTGHFKTLGSKAQSIMFSQLSSYGQNRRECPDKLFYKKGIFYLIDEKGKLITKKYEGILPGKKYSTWYNKVDAY